MIPIENQVCSKEVGEKLYWLDVKLPSFYTWKYKETKCSGTNHPVSEHPEKYVLIDTLATKGSKDKDAAEHYKMLRKKDRLFPAYLATEFATVLPAVIKTRFLLIQKDGTSPDRWRVFYSAGSGPGYVKIEEQRSENLADALGLMYAHLTENKLL